MEVSQSIGIGVLSGFRKDRFKGQLAEIETVSDTIPAVGLLELPRHLLEKWQTVWNSSATGATGPEVSPELFAAFARSVIEFLQFKKVPLPGECRCNLTMVPPKATPLETTKARSAEAGGSAVVINLGPEVASASFRAAAGPECDASNPKDEQSGKAESRPTEIQLECGQGYVVHDCASCYSECAGKGPQPAMFLLIEAN